MVGTQTTAFSVIFLLALSLTGSLRAQALEGTVVDASGEPLAGVTVFLDGTTRGDITGSEGHFSISAPQAGGYLLVASHVGYETLALEVLLREGETAMLPALRMQEAVISLGEVVVEAAKPGRRRRYLKTFEEDVLGRTTVARKARLVNPEVLSFERTEGGFKADASAPLIVENTATGYRIRVFMERYEHHTRTGGYRFAARLYFEEIARPSSEQVRTRERLHKGSMKHFLWAWYHGRTRQEGFYVHGELERPRRLGDVAYGVRREAMLVEYGARPDGAYRSFLSRHGVAPPFSKAWQVSRIAFGAGVMRVTANGHPIGPVRQEGYWAFAGVGDAVPMPSHAEAEPAARLPINPQPSTRKGL